MMTKKYRCYFDGASRGNPGPASYGVALYEVREVDDEKEAEGEKKEELVEVAHEKEALECPETNNVAEYLGCLAAVQLCALLEIRDVQIFGDSKLVVEQVSGRWRVKHPRLKGLHAQIMAALEEARFASVEFRHVKRHLNKRADQLANLALDEGKE